MKNINRRVKKRIWATLLIYVVVIACLIQPVQPGLAQSDGVDAGAAMPEAVQQQETQENEQEMEAIPEGENVPGQDDEPQATPTPVDESAAAEPDEGGVLLQEDMEPVPDAAWEQESAASDSAISGRVWLDENGDGVKDEGEQILTDVALLLEHESESGWQSVGEMAADEDGYLFDELPGGAYRVTASLGESLSGLYRITADEGLGEGALQDEAGKSVTIGVVLGQGAREFIDFAVVLQEEDQTVLLAQSLSISGVAFLDIDADNIQDANEPGVTGIRAVLQQKQQDESWVDLPDGGVTGQNGAYTFTGVEEGVYRVILQLGSGMGGALTLNPLNTTFSSMNLILPVPAGELWLGTGEITLSSGDTDISIPACALKYVDGNVVILDTATALVTSFAQLKSVLEDPTGIFADITYIYLGADIKGESGGITIKANKRNITLDGRPPGAPEGFRFTYTDYNTAVANQDHVVILVSAMNFTVKNLEIMGYNYFGTFSFNFGSSLGANMSYDNISYTGPQMVYNPYGSVSCNGITAVLEKTSTIGAEEFAEAKSLTLSGEINITRVAPSSGMGTLRSVFNMYGDAEIIVSTGANVRIATYDYLIWNAKTTTDLTVMEGAVMQVDTANGFMTIGTSKPMRKIDIRAGGALVVTQSGGTSLKRMLAVSESLSVGKGAVLDVRCASNLAAIEARGNLSINFDSPERVVLSSPIRVMQAVGTASVGSLAITTKAANLWTAGTLTDSIENMPSYLWNNLSLDSYAISAAFNSKGMTGASVSPGFTKDDPANDFNTGTFNVTGAQVLVLGNFGLTVDAVYADSAAVKGSATAGAEVRADYVTAASATQTATVNAPEGTYLVDVSGSGLLEDSRVEILGHYNFLKAKTYTDVNPALGALSFSVPDVLAFETATLSVRPQTIHRMVTGWEIVVTDTRAEKADWTLRASTDGSLVADAGGQSHILDGSLVFKSGGSVNPLGNEPMDIYTHQTAGTAQDEITHVSWDGNEGFLVAMKGPSCTAGLEYSATVTWTLVDGP